MIAFIRLIAVICISLLGLVMPARAETNDCMDAAISEAVTQSFLFRHSKDKRRAMDRALGLCGMDSNRLCRVLATVAQSDTNSWPVVAAYIGKYGTTNDVEFLYSIMGTSPTSAYNAYNSILRLEGVTDRIVSVLSNMTQQTLSPSQMEDASCVKMEILRTAFRAEASSSERVRGRSFALDFLSGEAFFLQSMDEMILAGWPEVRNTRRRLSALRSARSAGVACSQTNYVASAIAELEAYPEADLPE